MSAITSAMDNGMRPAVFQDFSKTKSLTAAKTGERRKTERPDIDVEVMDFLTKKNPEAAEKKGWILRNVLTKEECQALIAVSEGRGYQDADDFCFMYYKRENDRLMCHDAELADFLWQRIAPHIPEELEFDTGKTWRAYGLNDRFRICRYKPGGHFGVHADGMFGRSNSDRSFLTCMLYLNDGFSGGHTDFVKNAMDQRPNYTLVPETGLCVVFRQADTDCYHCGTTLKTGVKYIIRTDVMFKCQESSV